MKKLCSHPGCRVVFTGSGFKCPAHKTKARSKLSQEKHTQENQKFYRTKQWITVRNSHVSEYPICEYCQRKVATQVDHFLEYDLDECREYIADDQNLVSTCDSCHLEKGRNIRKLIQKGNTNEIRNWLIQNHPRTAESDYLKTAAICITKSGEEI
ncbi:HNH endonuclease [Aeromonas jandaei]|nr:HNH endonuclease [Aeromonas jandaei]